MTPCITNNLLFASLYIKPSQYMETPSRRRIPHQNTKVPPSTFVSSSSLTDQNIPPVVYKIGQKCSQAIQKSFATLDRQLSQNRAYLANFQNKLERVYQLESLRGTLKQREYGNLLTELDRKKEKYEREANAIREENQKDYKEIIEENGRLAELKKSYEELLKKEQLKYTTESTKIKDLCQKNNETKQKIKNLWKQLGAEQFRLKSLANSLEPSEIACKKNHTQCINTTVCTDKSSIVIEQEDSLYVTRNIITEPPQKQSNPLKLDFQFSKIVQNSNTPLIKYDQAIARIEDLQMSIIASKKGRNKNDNDGISASQNEARKQKIRERIEQVQYTSQMLKLFIVYLKSNDNTDNRTGFTNLRKIICYFEKLQKEKQDALCTLKGMCKNLGILITPN